MQFGRVNHNPSRYHGVTHTQNIKGLGGLESLLLSDEELFIMIRIADDVRMGQLLLLMLFTSFQSGQRVWQS